MIHKADQPDVVVNFFDADGLPGKILADIAFLSGDADAAATGDRDRSVMREVVDIRQCRDVWKAG